MIDGEMLAALLGSTYNLSDTVSSRPPHSPHSLKAGGGAKEDGFDFLISSQASRNCYHSDWDCVLIFEIHILI